MPLVRTGDRRFVEPIRVVAECSRAMDLSARFPGLDAGSSPKPSLERLLEESVWVEALARGLVDDAHEAEDVAQNARAAALSHAPDDPSHARSWLVRVVRNFARLSRLRRSRRERRERESARPEAISSTADLVVRAELQRQLVGAVLALAEPYRDVVLLRYFDSLPPREIAARQRVPVETVRTRLKRALAQLREKLDREHGRGSWAVLLLPAMPALGVLTLSTTTKVAAVAVIAIAGVLAWRVVDPFVGDESSAPEVGAAERVSPAVVDRSILVPEVARTEESHRAVESREKGGLAVRVLDLAGKPLKARLYVGSRNDLEPVEGTDDSGTAHVDLRDDASWIAARAVGMQPRERPLPTPRPDEVTFVLEPGATISGTVTIGEHEPVGAGVRVVALDPDFRGGIERLAAVCRHRAIGAIAETDASGSFLLEGLAPGTSYPVVAGGRGFISLPKRPPIPAGAEHVKVRVGGVYALQLEITQRGGVPLPFDSWFGPAIGLPDDETLRVDDHRLAVVAGVPLGDRAFTRQRRTFVHYRADANEERIGPLGHHVREAGFVPIDVEMWLPRFTDTLASQKVEVEPMPDTRFGRVTIEVLGEDDVFKEGEPSVLVGQLYLSRQPTNEMGWETVLRGGDGHNIVVRGVPFGDYTWYFQPIHGHYQAPMIDGGRRHASVKVEGDDARITLDLREYGDVEFEVFRADGSAWEESLTVHVEALRSRIVQGFAHVSKPPYVVPALRPGRHRASVFHAGAYSSNNDSTTIPVEFEVLAGTRTRCRLTIP